MKKLFLLFAWMMVLPVTVLAQASEQGLLIVESSPLSGTRQRAAMQIPHRLGVRAVLQYEKQPDMKVPHYGHQTFVQSNKLWVAGGYTSADQLTTAAEYIDYEKDNPNWLRYQLDKAYGRGFVVKRRLSEGSNISTGWLFGGGQFNNGSFVGSSATSVNTFLFTGAIVGFKNGPKLSTPRAMAKAIYVNGKTYVSGNWQGDDTTMDLLEQGDAEFKPVGETNGHCKPYMFADSLGRVMVMSAYDNNGEISHFYSDGNGNKMLAGDLYNPLTNETRLIGLRDFTPLLLPMMLPDDAKTDDYHVTYNDGSNRYFVLLRSDDGNYVLYNINMDNMSIGYFRDFDIPTKDNATGLDITWRGSVIANKNRSEVYLMGTSGPATNQTLHIISFSYRTQEWTIASARGFKYDMLTASWTLLKDGRLASTGGCAPNGDAQTSVYLFYPPVAGTTQVVEPDDNDEGGEGLCVVVESTDGKKVRYLLEEDPRFYLSGQTVTVTTTKLTIDYQAEAIARVYLENNYATDIDVSQLPALKEGSLNVEAGRIVITGLEAGETATVYQLTGIPVATAKADQEGRIVISIDDTPGKVSIVKTKHQSFKIIRK